MGQGIQIQVAVGKDAGRQGSEKVGREVGRPGSLGKEISHSPVIYHSYQGRLCGSCSFVLKETTYLIAVCVVLKDSSLSKQAMKLTGVVGKNERTDTSDQGNLQVIFHLSSFLVSDSIFIEAG